MKKKILTFLILPLFFLLLGFILINPMATSAAEMITDPIEGLNVSAGDAFAQAKINYDSGFLQTKTGQIVGLVLSFVGVIFLALMIYAGILWMTAAGNEQQVAKSKSLMINATIGLIVVFAAYAITTFIGGEIIK